MLKLNPSQQAVVAACLSSDSATRRGICASSGLSWAAVSKSVSQLQEMGIISEESDSTPTARGRRPTPLRPGEKLRFAGLAVRGNAIDGVLTTLAGEIVKKQTLPLTVEQDPFERSIELVKELMVEPRDLIGVVISFPGVIDPSRSTVLTTLQRPNVINRDGAEEIREGLGLDIPVFIERNAVCDLAWFLSEYTNEPTSTPRDVFLLSVVGGVSSALYVDGQVLYGKSGNIGEFGHLRSEHGDIKCRCGGTGCIETLVGGRAWKESWRNLTGNEDLDDALEKKDSRAEDLIIDSLKALFPPLAHLLILMRPDDLVFITDLPSSLTKRVEKAISDSASEYGVLNLPSIRVIPKAREHGARGAAKIGAFWLSGNPHYQR